MKRKVGGVLLALLVMLTAAPAKAAYWEYTEESRVHCDAGSIGCQVLQMVMFGNFASFDPTDSLSDRVFSAALSHLCEITEEDFAHFLAEFPMDESLLRRYYYIALGNCLWADIIIAPSPGGEADYVRIVLHIFLDPFWEEGAQDKRATIRDRMNDGLISIMAEALETPESFVRYIIFTDNWRDEEENSQSGLSADLPADEEAVE